MLLKDILKKQQLKDVDFEKLLSAEGFIYLRQKMPKEVQQKVSIVTLEFAGIKFQEHNDVKNG